MRLNYLLLSIFLFSFFIGYSQNQKESFFRNIYISGDLNYRSYGTGDLNGFGGGIELSKDIKKWLGIGLNISNWDAKRIDWDFVDPFTVYHHQYDLRIREFKISPFVQLIPVNTKHFDFITKLGVRTGYYNQNYYTGSYYTDYSNQVMDVNLNDIGYKGINLGYELGFELRFQFDRVIVVPGVSFSNDTNANSYSQLSLKLGWQLP